MRGQLIQIAENNFLVKVWFTIGLSLSLCYGQHSHEIEPRTEQPAQQAFPFGFGSTEKDRGTGFLVLAAREMKREPKPHGIETRRLTTETHTRAVFVLVKTCSYKLINGTVCALFRTPGGTPLYMPWVCADPSGRVLACKIIRFSSPPTAKSEEKRMFTQTSRFLPRFGLKTGMGFEGTAECLRIYSFNSK